MAMVFSAREVTHKITPLHSRPPRLVLPSSRKTDQACSHHDSTVPPPSVMTKRTSMTAHPNQLAKVAR